MSTSRYYRLEFERYGGEVCMGKISEDQFNYWEGKDDEFYNINLLTLLSKKNTIILWIKNLTKILRIFLWRSRYLG